MLRNYIIVSLRLLKKNKVFSLINVLGLATGIACCVLITLYIQDEFTYEKGFRDGDKIFRINTTFVKDGIEDNTPAASPSIAPGITEAFPEVENFTRVMKPLNTEVNIVRYEDKTFFEKNAFLVDSTFLQIFPFALTEGDAATALSAPSTALLSQTLAEKIFGKQSALDQMLIINSGTSSDTFRITGVVVTPRYPSHLDADIYMSMNSNGWGRWVLSQTTWANNNVVWSYLKLGNPDAYKNVEAKMPALLDQHAGEELKSSGRKKILSLQPLDDIRLYSNLQRGSSGSESSRGITYVYIVGTIGLFILLLACINFMNLTTAKSSQRASEVGIRKSMGAFRANLVRQFMGEAIVIVCFAVVLAAVMVVIALPWFNEIMQKQLTFNAANLPFIVASTLVIAAITAVLAGSYPSFFLSSLKPTHVLKGKSLTSDGSKWLRKGLVVLQFVITITLISSIVIIQRQLEFMQSKSLGFNTEEVVMIPMRTGQAASQYVSMKDAFNQLSGVHMVAATSSVPSTPLSRDWGVYKQGWTNEQSVFHDVVNVDMDYFKVMGIDIVAGRDFIVGQDNVVGDTINPLRIIVNESSLTAFSIPLEEAVGATIYFEPGQERYSFSIIGVVKDFHQFSLHKKIRPMLFLLPQNRNFFPYMAASVRMDSYQQTLSQMEEVWRKQVNDAPFESIFLNENIRKLYSAEQRTSTILTISTTIALLISSLGLYGLSVYVAERRTKEIGIRKVVGASVESIVRMLSTEYIKLVAISFVISVPLGYYFMTKWLEGFAYKITPGVLVFAISGFVSFLIAWLTVSFESYRAAHKNPVETLRNN